MKLVFCSFLFLCVVATNSSMAADMKFAAAENKATDTKVVAAINKPRPCLKRKSDALEGCDTLQDITNDVQKLERNAKKRKIAFKRDASLTQVHQYKVGAEEEQNHKERWEQIARNEKDKAIAEETTNSDSEVEQANSDSENGEGIQRLLEENKKKNLALGNSNPEQVRAQYTQKSHYIAQETLEMPTSENIEGDTTFLLNSEELCSRYEQTQSQALGDLGHMGICDFYDDM